eukprot:532094-Hanusia_phi.AAC.1
MPPNASTSWTKLDLAGPPIDGLHGCQAILSKFNVISKVFDPVLLLAIAASHPECPAPTTITSK